MAGRHIALWRLIAALTLAVGLLHWAVLVWLAAQWQELSVLRPMATPMFTRLLTPAMAVPPPQRHPGARRKAESAAAVLAAALAPTEPVPKPESALESTAPAAPSVAVPASQPAVADATAAPSLPTSAAPATPNVDSWPPNTRLRYVLSGNYRGALHGDAQVQWQREGGRYQVQLEISIGWLAHLSMTSQGQVTPDELRPEVFEEDNGSGRRHMLFTAQELVLMNGARQPRPAGVQDTTSQFVELSHRFAQAPTPLAVGQSVEVWLARPGGADVWTYDVVALETLFTPRHGEVAAFHLKPRPLAKPRGPITAEIWFAPTLQYLPVRIKITLNDETWVDLLVDKIEQSVATAPS
jgi:hypothetical protein